MTPRSWCYGAMWLGCLYSSTAAAHLMVAQHGTLNRAEGGYFTVVSLPITAFAGGDDNGDGRLDHAEFARHRVQLTAEVADGLTLFSAPFGVWPLDGLLLNLPHSHDDGEPGVTHVVAMGRFTVDPEARSFQLQTSLFGDTPQTQRLFMTLTEGASEVEFVLTPDARDFSFEVP